MQVEEGRVVVLELILFLAFFKLIEPLIDECLEALVSIVEAISESLEVVTASVCACFVFVLLLMEPAIGLTVFGVFAFTMVLTEWGWRDADRDEVLPGECRG